MAGVRIWGEAKYYGHRQQCQRLPEGGQSLRDQNEPGFSIEATDRQLKYRFRTTSLRGRWKSIALCIRRQHGVLSGNAREEPKGPKTHCAPIATEQALG